MINPGLALQQNCWEKRVGKVVTGGGGEGGQNRVARGSLQPARARSRARNLERGTEIEKT